MWIQVRINQNVPKEGKTAAKHIRQDHQEATLSGSAIPVSDKIAEATAAVKKNISEVGHTVSENLANVIHSAKAFSADMLEKSKDSVVDMGHFAADITSKGVSTAKDIAINTATVAGHKMSDVGTSAATSAKNVTSGITTGVMTSVANVSHNTIETGKDSLHWVEDKMQDLVDSFKNMGSTVMETTKKALHSDERERRRFEEHLDNLEESEKTDSVDNAANESQEKDWNKVPVSWDKHPGSNENRDKQMNKEANRNRRETYEQDDDLTLRNGNQIKTPNQVNDEKRWEDEGGENSMHVQPKHLI